MDDQLWMKGRVFRYLPFLREKPGFASLFALFLLPLTGWKGIFRPVVSSPFLVSKVTFALNQARRWWAKHRRMKRKMRWYRVVWFQMRKGAAKWRWWSSWTRLLKEERENFFSRTGMVGRVFCDVEIPDADLFDLVGGGRKTHSLTHKHALLLTGCRRVNEKNSMNNKQIKMKRGEMRWDNGRKRNRRKVKNGKKGIDKKQHDSQVRARREKGRKADGEPKRRRRKKKKKKK